MKIVPDTSVIVEGKISEFVKKKKFKKPTIIIPEIVISELESQANKGRETGFKGLEEIKRLRELEKKGSAKISYIGKRPSFDDIKLAKTGALDAIIRECAKSNKATLVTGDIVQAQVAEAKGILCEYVEPYVENLLIEDYFSRDVMSVHLKVGTIPKVKKGRPGKVKLVPLGKKKMDAKTLERLSRNILDLARREGRTEMKMYGASIVQLGKHRIAITRPPFSDEVEITAVRPIVRLSLKDYMLSGNLLKRLERAEGVLVAGPPGSGKTTFAQALAESYLKKGKIVKTMEKPRDLQVSDEITQYTALEGTMENTADILLLVRPDYTIFDELRKTSDFATYSDLRLAGVGMVGVVHAAAPIEAVQRMIGRVELGVIPQLVDTIIFIDDGKVKKVYKLEFNVKVPAGMYDDDLARPVIEVKDFETDEVQYEMYSFGEEVVVMPIKKIGGGAAKLAEKKVADEIGRYCRHFEVKVLSEKAVEVRVPEKFIPRLIGRDGKRISSLERRLGMKVQVKPL